MDFSDNLIAGTKTGFYGGLMTCIKVAVVGICGMLASTHIALSQEAGPHREITQITENVYRFQNGGHNTAFLVTDEGIALADPINADAAAWLKAELAERFEVPVRYVLYSHYHFDHVSGGAEFEDTATFIGHADMVENMKPVPEGAPLAIDDLPMDANGDNILQLSEAFFLSEEDMARIDLNGDGGMSRHERRLAFNPLIRAPDETFTDTRRINLGGQLIEMGHYTQYHSSDMSYVLFKDEKAIYVVDIISLKSSPNTRWADGPEDWIAAIQAIEALDFDVVIGGHGPAGTKADVTQLREYFEDVIATVSEGIERGESLQALQKSIKMEKYSAWQGHSDRLPAHIANAYAYLQAG